MCLLYKYDVDGVHGEFHYYDNGNNGHHIMLTRKGSNFEIARWNTAEECAAQARGLTMILNGKGSISVRSNHHMFHLDRVQDEVRTICHTTVPGFADDLVTLYTPELSKLLLGCTHSICDVVPPFEAATIDETRKELWKMYRETGMLK